ncbi:MAG: ATP-binding cassette domain-containing protein [Defluviitaleaceae bacterium]|nr:ATP-binding cassette domain-containing protein [Defluviitaleaceae bacterium]
MIQVNNVYKSFENKLVLKNFNAKFPVGINAIMGKSGIGKTTLVNIIAGLIIPDSGEILGVNQKKISIVFQEDRLIEKENVINNILFPVKNSEENLLKARSLMNKADLNGLENKKVKELSGGMKRRVAICRSLMINFDILILDEPFKGLDEKTKPAIMDMIKIYSNKIVLLITHDRREADYLNGNVLEFCNI